MVHRLANHVIVLTGASSGIGASIAEHLLKEGAKVSSVPSVSAIGVVRLHAVDTSSSSTPCDTMPILPQVCMGARRLDKLSEVQKSACDKYPDSPGALLFKQCDVTQKDSVRDLVKEAEEKLGDVDVIINCE